MEYAVTIGMPVYGVEKYIKKSLESALNQTFKSIEFIMVDDRGQDKSIDIISDIKKTHPRGKDIRIITQPQNIGCWAARNTILNEARGKYLFLMDSDDYISNDCIEILYNASEKYNTEAAYGSIQKVDDKDNELDMFKYDFRIFDKDDEFATYANSIHKSTITNFIWNILIRVDFIRKNNLQFPKTKFWDDVLFNANFQPLIRRAVILSNVTYFYVIRDNSLSSYEARNKIQIEEIRQHFANDKYLLLQCLNLKEKPYYEMRCVKMLSQTLYSIIGVLRNRNKISPSIKDVEIRNVINHPVPIKEIMRFKHLRKENLFFYLLGVLPPCISILMIRIFAKHKGLL